MPGTDIAGLQRAGQPAVQPALIGIVQLGGVVAEQEPFTAPHRTAPHGPLAHFELRDSVERAVAGLLPTA
jgi:hypothetical protein